MQVLKSARSRNYSNSADQKRILQEQHAFFLDGRLPVVGIFEKNSEVGRMDRHSRDWPCEGLARSDHPWFYICSAATACQLYMEKTGNDTPSQSFVKQ
jgi:hypothetical protein